MAKSTRVKKPKKPRGFPIWPHPSGRWCKKHKGRFIYFGPWDDREGALARYHKWSADPEADLSSDAATVKELANAFMASKERMLESGELSPRSYKDYYRTCGNVVKFFGRLRLIDDLKPADFGRLRAHLARKRNAVSLGNEINRVRILFKYAVDSGLTDRAVRYGSDFEKPSRKTLRKARAANGRRTFEAAELRKIIAAADDPMQSMVLLGINCGFGQSDVAEMPQSALDLKGGWVNYPRPKTGVDRRVKLWPETVKALKEAIASRPKPADRGDEGLVFLTQHGHRWVRVKRNERGEFVEVDSLIREFQKLLDAVGDVPRLGFYSLRHTHRTVSDEAKDQPAANAIMGHVPASDDMSAVYRQTISDERLKAVVDCVRKWLWPRGAKPKPR